VPLRIAIDIDGVLADPESEGPQGAETVENFWTHLSEIEPGAVSKLAETAAPRRWEIIFLSKRSPAAGATAQVQSQRWLESKGFVLPSVYVAKGPRGAIAAALGLDLVVDGSPEHCVDVVENSDARTILVWRADRASLPVEADRPEINIVSSFGECLEMLTATRERDPQPAAFLARVKRLLGLKEA
jgi:hypothetical protein